MEFFVGKKKRFIRGSISIMLAIIMVAMLSLSALLMEGGRFQLARQDLEAATISAALSMLAGHDEYLNERFGLFAMDNDLSNHAQFRQFLDYNANASGNGLARTVNITDTSFEGMYSLANPRVLQRQILEYYKYRGPAHIANEMLYIDKILDFFLDSLPNAANALYDLDRMADAADDLYDSLRGIYDFLVSIQMLNRGITGDPRGGGNAFPHNWHELSVSNFFVRNAMGTTVNPSFIASYEALRAAIQEKIDHMQDEPEDPGYDPAPLADLPSLRAFEHLLIATRGFLGDTGIIDEDEPIGLSGGQALQSLSHFGISNETSRRDFINRLNDELWARNLREISPTNISTLNDVVILSVESAIQWEEDNAEREAWIQEIGRLDLAINQAVVNYRNACRDIHDLLFTYMLSSSALVDNVDAAIKAFEALDDNTLFGDEGDDFTEIINELEEFRRLIPERRGNPVAGRDFLWDDQIRYFNFYFCVDMIDGDFTIDENTPLSSVRMNMTTHQYYMDISYVLNLLSHLDNLEVSDNRTDGVTIWDMLGLFIDMLAEMVHPIPKTHTPNFTVRLESPTTSLLPSNIVQHEYNTEADREAVDLMLRGAQSILPQYAGMIDKSNPLHLVALGQDGIRMERAINQVTGALAFLRDRMEDLRELRWIRLLLAMRDLLYHARNFSAGMTYIATNITTFRTHVLQSLGHGILLNTYAVEMFPNRLSSVGTITNRRGSPGMGGAHQAFAGAHAEYIVIGGYCERSNQSAVFWRIFILRMLDNIRVMFMCTFVKGILKKANVFSVILFPLWLYFETQLDMNLLIRRGQGVPALKGQVILSPKGLAYAVLGDETAIAGTLTAYRFFMYQEIGVKALRLGPISAPKMKYKDWLWFFLVFVSNQTKVLRMGDLIQMEARFGSEGNPNFLMRRANTYVRVGSSATFQSVLPVISLGDNQINNRGWGIRTRKYVGY